MLKLPLSIKQFVSEFFSGFFSFDTRFFNTFVPLLFKPGKVSRDYIEGKRRQYVNPFQLYLNVTIVFFLLQGLFSVIDEYKIANIADKSNEIEIEIDPSSEKAKKEESIFSISNESTVINGSFTAKFNAFVKYSFHNKNTPVSQALDSLRYKKTKWNIFYYKKAKDINNISNNSAFRKSYLDRIVSKISVALFFMLPLFTMFISLLYIRGKKNYTEHLVFVFNVQTVFFILLIFFTIFDRIFKTDIGIGLFFILFLFYLYKSLRNFYKQKRFKTIIKFLFLNFVFVLLSAFGGLFISFIALAL